MTNNQLAENSVIQLLNSVKLARDNAERADNRVDHSFYYALTIALEELQERRKAAMDIEPVILYRQVNPVNGMKTYWAELDPEEFRHLKQHTDENAEFMTLYRHAQPAPVVPDNRDITQHFDTIALETAREIMCDVNRRHEFLGGEIQLLSRIQCRIDDACRAAMLAAAQHDTPALNPVQSVVTVPGKWIPVSEQMPEVGEIVLIAMGGVVNVGEMECSAANCRFFTSVISGRELPATHWMPLPAAPQEVKP
ncbi:DUF551 domain-containing protein [Klebsiella pneumoniae]|uniref:DUF551 domain-containing protein n=1 Tax=Klebsiella pneumoniae TaxID=573 RepID=UPI000DE6DFDD|nr:DUF551 domain-containing protein [Klebsiella pneumoniae]MDE4719567.1 DUF551 domain-containing protein [Klebsiella pneumoniae]MDE4853926.1 DUF551 domain-containing protein [Klebsiella pneumoniae]SSH66411.1 Eaa1 [Klebsiella pneumoniae]HDY7165109.1 DUF551 domain-containing protein [Klebsiella pneumoniae]